MEWILCPTVDADADAELGGGDNGNNHNQRKAHGKNTSLTLTNAAGPPVSLRSLINASVCWYNRSSAAEDDRPSDTKKTFSPSAFHAFGVVISYPE